MDVCKRRFDVMSPIDYWRRSAALVNDVIGEEVYKLGEVLAIKRLGHVGSQLLYIEDVRRRAKSKREKEERKEK